MERIIEIIPTILSVNYFICRFKNKMFAQFVIVFIFNLNIEYTYKYQARIREDVQKLTEKFYLDWFGCGSI